MMNLLLDISFGCVIALNVSLFANSILLLEVDLLERKLHRPLHIIIVIEVIEASYSASPNISWVRCESIIASF